MHAPEPPRLLFRLGGQRVAGAHRVDEHHVGEGQPGAVIVGELGICAIRPVGREIQHAGAGGAHLQIRAAGAGATVEKEADRAGASLRAVQGVGGVIDGGGNVAVLIAQFQRAGCGRVGQRLAVHGDLVLRYGIGGQHRQPRLGLVGRWGGLGPCNGGG